MPQTDNTQLGTYRHYKGTLYEIITFGTHTETEEKMVVYRSLEEPEKVWIRPYDTFFETVVVDDEIFPRFARIEK